MQPFTISLQPKDKKNKTKNKKKRSGGNVFGEVVNNQVDGSLKKPKKILDGKHSGKKIKLTEFSQNDFLKVEEPTATHVISLEKNDTITATQEMATAEDYNSVPVEDFGCAILRGMGWDGETDDTDNAKDENVLKDAHAEGLGIGAKGTNIRTETKDFMPVVKAPKSDES